MPKKRSQTRLWLLLYKIKKTSVTLLLLLAFSLSENGSLMTLQTWREIVENPFNEKITAADPEDGPIASSPQHLRQSTCLSRSYLPLVADGYETAVGAGGPCSISQHIVLWMSESSHTFIFLTLDWRKIKNKIWIQFSGCEKPYLTITFVHKFCLTRRFVVFHNMADKWADYVLIKCVFFLSFF